MKTYQLILFALFLLLMIAGTLALTIYFPPKYDPLIMPYLMYTPY